MASFLANVIVDGVIFTVGASLLPLWLRDFQTTDTAVSLTMSILSGSYLLVGKARIHCEVSVKFRTHSVRSL